MHKVFFGAVLLAAGMLVAWQLVRDRPSTAVPHPAVVPERSETSPWDYAVLPAPSAPQPAGELQQEARDYIRELSESRHEPVPVVQADDFVAPDQELRFSGEKTYEKLSGTELLALERIRPDALLRVLRQREEVEYRTLADLFARHEGVMGTPLQVLKGDRVEQVTLGRLLEEKEGRLQESVPVIVLREYEEVITAREAARRLGGDPERSIQVVRSPDRPRSTTVRELLSGREAVDEDTVYYVRNVVEDDAQGIWGILHHGLIEKFAGGIAVRRNEEISRYQVHIPRNSDERLHDRSSSFLGRLLDEKTRRSYVYNYDKGRMGQNPDLVYPGQELLIVSFSTDELISVYEHFVARGVAALPTPTGRRKSLPEHRLLHSTGGKPDTPGLPRRTLP